MDNKQPFIGAPVLRGRVFRIEKDGKAVIEGIDQPGIITMPLTLPDSVKAGEGDVVLYCEFLDGQGAVLARIE